jgi:hypothetical protein
MVGPFLRSTDDRLQQQHADQTRQQRHASHQGSVPQRLQDRKLELLLSGSNAVGH